MKIYKEEAEDGFTPEQKDKWKQLMQMGWKDVAKVWEKWCNEQNWTDEWRAQHMRGQFEGVGMDEDL